MTTLSLILFLTVFGLLIVICYKQAQVCWYRTKWKKVVQQYNSLVNNNDENEYTYD